MGTEVQGTSSARLRLVDVARAVARDGMVVGTVGNMSMRVGDCVLITPTRVRYSQLGPADLVAVSLEGEGPTGGGRPSRELPLHLAVYQRRTDVAAIIHTHSPYATAWSFLGEPLLPTTEENEYYGIGPVLTSPPAPTGSARLAQSAAQCLADSSAVLLGRHGVLTAAQSIEFALEVARAVEHQAQIAWLLRNSQPTPISVNC